MAGLVPLGRSLSPFRKTLSPFLFLVLCLAVLIFQGCASDPQLSPVYSLSSPREAPRSAATYASDALLSARIKSKIRSDDLVSSQGAQIRVRRGVVYLDGTCVDRYQGRMLADLIRTVEGVAGVENRLKPAQTGTGLLSPNGFAAKKIRLRLQEDPALSRMDIRVNATSHQVVLTGSVATPAQKLKASAIAQAHAGERQVVNRLNVMAE